MVNSSFYCVLFSFLIKNNRPFLQQFFNLRLIKIRGSWSQACFLDKLGLEIHGREPLAERFILMQRINFSSSVTILAKVDLYEIWIAIFLSLSQIINAVPIYRGCILFQFCLGVFVQLTICTWSFSPILAYFIFD